MDRLKGLPLGRQIVLGAGVLLLIDTFFNWQQVSVAGHTLYSAKGWHGFLGIVMGLALVLLLIWTAAKAFEIELPVQVPDGVTTLGLSAVVVLFAFLKAVSDDAVHWPAWIGVILAAVMTYGAWLVFAGSGEELPSFMTQRSTTTPPDSPPSTGEE